MADNMWDFGFTAVDEEELYAVQQAEEKIQEATISASTAQERLNQLYNAVLPLLNNLKLKPEKPYLYWPDRVQKVEKFEDFINSIYHGE
jgi:hypothetical protein